MSKPKQRADETAEAYEARLEAWRARQHDYYVRNRDAILKQKHDYYERNRDALLARNSNYRERNHDALLAYASDYRERNRDAIRKQQSDYRERNRNAIAERKRDYREWNRTVVGAFQDNTDPSGAWGRIAARADAGGASIDLPPWVKHDPVVYVGVAVSALKIGTTTHIRERLSNLRHTHGLDLRLVAVVHGGPATEARLKAAVADYLVRGEVYDAACWPVLAPLVAELDPWTWDPDRAGGGDGDVEVYDVDDE